MGGYSIQTNDRIQQEKFSVISKNNKIMNKL